MKKTTHPSSIEWGCGEEMRYRVGMLSRVVCGIELSYEGSIGLTFQVFINVFLHL